MEFQNEKQFNDLFEQLKNLNKTQIVGLPLILTEAFEQTKSFIQDFQILDSPILTQSKVELVFSTWDQVIFALDPINPSLSDKIKVLRIYFFNTNEFLSEIQDSDNRLKLLIILDKSLHAIKQPLNNQ